VICTYSEERWEALVASVESVAAQSLRPAEVVVVVDNNRALSDRIRRRWPQLVAVDHTGEPGVSNARNAGIARALRGRVVAFLDDDAVAAPDWLERMADAYLSDSVLAVGGHVEPVWAQRRPGWFPREFDWVVGCSYAGLPERAAQVRNVTGANMSFRRDVLASLGGFEGRFGRCCDETELCIRAGQRWPEHSIVYDPAVRVRHLVPAERASWRYFVDRCYLEGRMKATVAKLRGGSWTLSSERDHVVRLLPASVAREVRESLGGRDPDGLRRAGAIVVGVVLAALGYVVESLRLSRAGSTLR
jgi:GT2 family glycosyltransferase